MKRMLTRKPLSKMMGLTLLETMFAIAIGALVLIGAVIFYMSTKQNANVNKTVGDMNAMVSAYESYVAGGNTLYTCDSLTTTSSCTSIKVLQDGGYLPGTGGNMYNAWGLAYGVSVVASASASTVTFTVTGLGAPSTDKSCAAIGAAVKGSASDIGTDACTFTYPL